MTDTATLPVWRKLFHTRLRDVVRGRIDGRLDWRQIVAEADLPMEMADAIVQVVRRTRLWRAEKVDVARELIAHFQDGLSTGRLPQQLLTTFGEPSTAARLIRRAKKRGRPAAWHAARWSCWALEAMVGLYVLMGVYLLFGRPSITTDYLAIINARAVAVPEAERAWPLYREAFTALGAGLGRADRGASPLVKLQIVEPGGEGWEKAVEVLEEHAAAIAQLRRAGQREELGLPVGSTLASFSADDRQLFRVGNDNSEMTGGRRLPDSEDRLVVRTLLPQLGLLLESAGALATDCRRAAIAGDAEAALDDVLAQLGISGHIQETSFLVTALGADAVRDGAFQSVHYVLKEHAGLWSVDQLRTLAHAIARTDIDWNRALDGERAFFYDTAQRVYTDDGEGDGRIVPGAVQKLIRTVANSVSYGGPSWLQTLAQWIEKLPRSNVITLPAANLMVASRKEMTDTYDQYLDILAKALRAEYLEQLSTNELAAIEAHIEGEKQRYILVRIFAPYAGIPLMADQRRGLCDGVLMGIALELYRREVGNWPQSLDELSPRWLPALPVDRITGQSLQYRIVESNPIVYSVGLDRDDDGGREATGAQSDPRGYLLGVPPGRRSLRPTEDPNYDGDWVIWSMEQGAGNRE